MPTPRSTAPLRKPALLPTRAELLLTSPSFLWLLALFAVPTALVVWLSFRVATPGGGLGDGLTLDSWRALGDPSYPAVFARTIVLSAIATAACIAVALPVAFLMGRSSTRTSSLLLLLFVVPFWTNFLIRVIAWRQILHVDGPLKSLLVKLGLAHQDTMLLYNPGAVLLVMVYTYLPFAILPLYAAAEKFDYQLLDAARDLGAGPLRAFFSVFLPGIRRGLAVALIMVFIPGLGSYVIPDLVGGTGGEMLGNIIARRVFGDRNLPHGAALASLLMLLTIATLLFAWLAGGRAKSENTSTSS